MFPGGVRIRRRRGVDASGPRALRIAWALAVASASVVACSAIVGVEDVTLAKRDASDVPPEGDGDTTDTGEPPLPTDGSVAPQVQLALGFNHTCARKKSGTVLCWGDNGAGQLGDGIPFDAGPRPDALVPQAVKGIDDAIAIASGLSHTCVVRKAGTVACWGINSFGQLGNGTKERSSSPGPVIGLANAVALSGGTSFTCALQSNGKVSCWGANYSGQLGDNTKVDRTTASDVLQLDGAKGIATGEHHACAIVGGGAVKCWGKNDDGQLGTGNTTESLVPVDVGLSDVAQVVAASRFTCARQNSGQVYCWGANYLGQLGTGTANAAPNPSPTSTVVRDALSIWVGYEHACAARKTGETVCWGAAGDGQLGSGTVAAEASIPDPRPVVGLASALEVSTGGNHSCATTVSGAVYCWGSNSLGQCGNGTRERAYAAVKVSGFP